MFILFGFGKQTVKYLGSAGDQVCPNCGNRREWSRVRIRTWFTLFFVPIIPYSTRSVVSCPICHYGVNS